MSVTCSPQKVRIRFSVRISMRESVAGAGQQNRTVLYFIYLHITDLAIEHFANWQKTFMGSGTHRSQGTMASASRRFEM